MWRFIRVHFNGKDMSTLLESCGVADLIATCSGGRNRRVSEAFVRTGKVSSDKNVYHRSGSVRWQKLSWVNLLC